MPTSTRETLLLSTMQLATESTEFNSVSRRIRTLTALLQSMCRKGPATRGDEMQISPILRHTTTLITCGDENTVAATDQVIAVTGSHTAKGLNFLAVLQNSSNPEAPPPSKLTLEVLSESQKSFAEVIGE